MLGAPNPILRVWRFVKGIKRIVRKERRKKREGIKKEIRDIF